MNIYVCGNTGVAVLTIQSVSQFMIYTGMLPPGYQLLTKK